MHTQTHMHTHLHTLTPDTPYPVLLFLLSVVLLLDYIIY